MSIGNVLSQRFASAKLANTVDGVIPDAPWQRETTAEYSKDQQRQPLSQDAFLPFDLCRSNRSVRTHTLSREGGFGQSVTLVAGISICKHE